MCTKNIFFTLTAINFVRKELIVAAHPPIAPRTAVIFISIFLKCSMLELFEGKGSYWDNWLKIGHLLTKSVYIKLTSSCNASPSAEQAAHLWCFSPDTHRRLKAGADQMFETQICFCWEFSCFCAQLNLNYAFAEDSRDFPLCLYSTHSSIQPTQGQDIN